MAFGRWTVDRDLKRDIRTTPIGIANDEIEGRLEDEVECPVCYTILLTAMKIAACAHSICGTCADTLPTKRCPKCRTDFDSVSVDEETRQRAGEVPAKCSLCGFQGKVRDVLQHKKADCTFQTVYCRREGCHDTLQRGLLYQHEESCDYKKVTCLCSYKTIQMDLDRHLKTDCATHPIQCPVPGCGRPVERAKVAVHITQECKQTVASCHVPGCGFVGRAKDMAGHAEEFAKKHVGLLSHYNDRLKIGLVEGKLQRSDASLAYGEVKAILFTIPYFKREVAMGTTAFTSPSRKDVFNAEWQVSLENQGIVWFLLQSPDRGEDHAICLSETLEVRENKKYGTTVPYHKLTEYSDHGDQLVVKVLMQKVSASVKM
ncbi:TNF receptor-associated factor 6-B-like isoform X2 [Branchiostoma lanceolatum]|uniref:TNF receptor-associated factor 6-B-like isoform X2 n=1 Tax=Branchiostoma lanceolatum TaxID=7740 RepID=UPI003455ED73